MISSLCHKHYDVKFPTSQQGIVKASGGSNVYRRLHLLRIETYSTKEVVASVIGGKLLILTSSSPFRALYESSVFQLRGSSKGC